MEGRLTLLRCGMTNSACRGPANGLVGAKGALMEPCLCGIRRAPPSVFIVRAGLGVLPDFIRYLDPFIYRVPVLFFVNYNRGNFSVGSLSTSILPRHCIKVSRCRVLSRRQSRRGARRARASHSYTWWNLKKNIFMAVPINGFGGVVNRYE